MIVSDQANHYYDGSLVFVPYRSEEELLSVKETHKKPIGIIDRVG